jgi:two-component system, sensor histidine kinase and response regulator
MTAKTILVIEDDPLIQEVIQDVLALEGYRTLAADNGAVGVELALAHQPNLILCDVAMPEMDGYEVLTTLQRQQTTHAIPFIFLTARTTPADLRRGMNLGADDYLAKPCTADELIGAISTRFEKQAALKQQSEERLNHLRGNIAKSLPHELYTPLNGILGLAEVLVQESETIERFEIKEFAESIHTSALRLHHLMQNFLLYTKLELLTHNPDQVQFLQAQATPNPNQIIATVAAQTAAQFERDSDLRCELLAESGSLPECLRADSLQIAETHWQKIVEELVSNACKFSEPLQPVIVESAIQLNCLSLRVTNLGRGMTADQIASLGAYMQFERLSYEQQGTGLGLIIVKRLVELYSGSFEIDSIPGKSTTVTVTVPTVTVPTVTVPTVMEPTVTEPTVTEPTVTVPLAR